MFAKENLKKLNYIERLYIKLRKKYGKPMGQWGLWCKRPKNEKEKEEVIMGAILTQRTNWNNVELAIKNLKKEKINSLYKIIKAKRGLIEQLIKPAGFYKTKSFYLVSLAKFIVKNYGDLKKMKRERLEKLREKLLKLKGIGPETADSILLYALEKPVFVIDEYTKRLVKEKGLSNNFSYSFLQEMFQKKLKKDFRLYQDFHALIVINGKNKDKFIKRQ